MRTSPSGSVALNSYTKVVFSETVRLPSDWKDGGAFSKTSVTSIFKLSEIGAPLSATWMVSW